MTRKVKTDTSKGTAGLCLASWRCSEHVCMFCSSKGVVATTLALLLCIVACKSKPTPTTKAALSPVLNRSLAVAEVPTAETLSDAAATQVLQKASSILRQNSCGLALSLSGSVSALNVKHSTIFSPNDYDDVCTQPGYVHVVDGINWCDGATTPNILGCSSNPGTCMVVVRYNPSVSDDPQQVDEAILWLHEYGHTRNLKHRNDSNAVMNPTIDSSHLNVSASECSAYLGVTSAASSQSAQPAAASVEDFVHRVYIHGVPFEQAKRYKSKADVKTLTAILQDHSQERYWANAVSTLGIIGTPEASEQLVSFVSRGEGNLSPAAFRAKTSAVVAMGYVLGQSGRQSVLNYLVKSADPKSWANVSWSIPSSSDTGERDLTLAKGAVAALGVSGDPKAQTALRDLQLGGRIDTAFSSQIQKSAGYALNESKAVQQKGFDAYVIANEQRRVDPAAQIETPKTKPQ